MISGLLLALYIIIGLALYTMQRRMMYFPPNGYLSPQTVGLSTVEEVSLDGAQGQIRAWWQAPQTPDKSVIMFFHGNASAVFSNADIYADLVSEGYGLLGVGYPGYPGSQGQPTQDTLTQAAHLQYDWIIEQGIDPERIVFFGTSLGAGVAAQLSVYRSPRLLIMEAPFQSMLHMVRLRMPPYGLPVWVKDEYRSDKVLENVPFPVLILHGTDDHVIPAGESEKLYRQIEGPKSRHVISGGQHTNLWGLGGREIILETLSDITARN